jgi:hypothetical protein
VRRLASAGWRRRFQQHLEHIGALPKTRQRAVMDVSEALLARQGRRRTGVEAMTAVEMNLIEKLKRLPPSRVAEVVDFVDFLAARE